MFVRFGFLVVAAMSLAFGLDPTRTLTQYAHRVWQAQQGLPQGTLYSILQTHDGYIWLGSQTGLIRFDGVRFETLENIRPAAPGNVWVRGALEDSNHALWMATAEAGIFRMDRDSIVQYSKAEGLPAENVTCLAAAQNGDIWACTDAGAVRIHQNTLTVFPTESPVRAACEASEPAVLGRLEIHDAQDCQASRRCVGSRAGVFGPGVVGGHDSRPGADGQRRRATADFQGRTGRQPHFVPGREPRGRNVDRHAQRVQPAA